MSPAEAQKAAEAMWAQRRAQIQAAQAKAAQAKAEAEAARRAQYAPAPDIQLPGGIVVQGGAPVLKDTSVLNGYDPSIPRGYGR